MTATPTEAHPQAALDAAIEAARLAAPKITGPDGAAHVFLPRGFSLTRLPDDTAIPAWPRQAVTLDTRDSLTQYARRHGSEHSIMIADYDAGQITARLDWHPHNQHADYGTSGTNGHSATLVLRHSEEFARWDAMAGKMHQQEDFARFLEENSSDVGYPEAATMVEISRDFEATVGQSYKSSLRLDNGDRRLRFETEAKVMNEVVIPQRFTLSIPVYPGEDPEDIVALFRWRPNGGGGVLLGFEWHRLEYRMRARFAEIARIAAEDTGMPVFFGRIER